MTTTEEPAPGTTLLKFRTPAKRNQWGQYLLPPLPDEDPKGPWRGWQRTTTIIKAIEDSYNLTRWSERMLAVGLATRPDLLALAASTPAHDRSALNDICEKAKQAAQADMGSNLGTAVHQFCERADLGEKIFIPAEYRRDIEAYRAKMDELGFTHLHVEAYLVNTEIRVAGTTDRITMIQGIAGAPYILDLKTSRTLDYSWGAFAAQLGTYANAAWMFDYDTERYAPMPEVNKEMGIVVWLPVGEGRCEVFAVDIAAGWEAAKLARRLADWQHKDNVAKLWTPFQPAHPYNNHKVDQDPTPALPSERVDAQDQFVHNATIAWLKVRLKTLNEKGGSHAAALISGRWPKGVPLLKKGCIHTPDQLELLHQLFAEVEKQFRAPFPPPDPREVGVNTN